MTVETEEFILIVDSKGANFQMKAHYPTIDEARTVAEAFFRRWEVLIGLEHNPGDLMFTFQDADVIDRAPVESNSTIINVHSTIEIHSTVDAVIHLSRGKLPSAPQKFDLSPDVETMYMRYKAFREGRESLLSMAYMCLTVLEASAGDRANAAKKYSIAKLVLDTLGKLCSQRGRADEARKTPRNGAYVPLSDQEKDWIVQVIKAIIRRAGERAYEPKARLRQITLDDFPNI